MKAAIDGVLASKADGDDSAAVAQSRRQRPGDQF
jgi:hypothetical protein